MSTNDRCDNGCSEYRGLSRRRFVGLSAGALAAVTVPGWVPRVVYASEDSSSRDVLVHIFLRGGWDSLSVCVPYEESTYYDRRPTLALPAPGSGPGSVIDLDGFFGFAAPMEPLIDAYQNGDLLVVQATGSMDPTRSHFDAMHFMEVGVPQPPSELFTGWLGRHLVNTAPTVPDAVLRAVGIGFALPRAMVGGPNSVAVPDFVRFGFGGDPASEAERRDELGLMYELASEPLRTAAESTMRTIDLLESINFEGYQPSGEATYPEGQLGQAMSSTAALIKADVGVEAVSIDFGSWDTHERQNPLDGWMAGLMENLAGSLGAFHTDLFTDGRTNVTVVVMSEFGRNAFENGSAGTDHGHGSTMLVLGGGIAGGQVLTQWPGLATGQLYEGQDLAVTIDYRDIVAEIVQNRLGNDDLAGVFPDPTYEPTFHGVTR